jgi:hypothetical protein
VVGETWGKAGSMNASQFRLFTKLQPTECVSRLSAAIDAERFGLPTSMERWWGLKPVKHVAGRVSESSLRLRKHIQYRNSFQTLLRARMKPLAGGTIITGNLAMHPAVWCFIFVGFAFLVTIGGLGMVLGAAEGNWIAIPVPLIMLALMFGLVRIGRYAARDEGRFLKDFLIQTLDAQPVDRKTLSEIEVTSSRAPQ